MPVNELPEFDAIHILACRLPEFNALGDTITLHLIVRPTFLFCHGSGGVQRKCSIPTIAARGRFVLNCSDHRMVRGLIHAL